MEGNEFYEAWWFIDNHPAFKGKGVASIDVSVNRCCRNGISYEPGDFDLTIFKSDEPDIFNMLVEQGFEADDCDDEYAAVDAPYSAIYGCEWEFDRNEIWLEGGCVRYVDDYEVIPIHDVKLDCGGRTYEAAIIKFAGLVKENYGDWSSTPGDKNSIVPAWVNEYNKRTIVNFEDSFSCMVKSIKHVYITDGEINELWWQKSGLVEEFFNYNDTNYYIDVNHIISGGYKEYFKALDNK